jgi:ADP-dependent phosphofructokinase/glucokinase
MSSSTLILPLIHLGGTSPVTLMEDYSAARLALEEALRLLSVSYHDRDYYQHGIDKHREARGQHLARCAAIGNVIAALDAMEGHACEAQDARAAARTPPQWVSPLAVLADY